MVEILRNKNLATRFQILVEVADKGPNIKQHEIDRKVTGSNRALTYTTVPDSFVGGKLELSVVAEAGGQIVGFLLGSITESPYGSADSALMRLIGVDPAYQRRGIGTALVQGTHRVLPAKRREVGALMRQLA